MNKDKRILVTGAAGYIGSHLIKNLASRGFTNVWGIDKGFYTSPNTEEIRYSMAGYWHDDLAQTDWNRFEREKTEPFDAIVHLAAYISVEESVKNPGMYWLNNMASLGNIIRQARWMGSKLYFASTGTAFDPASPYAETKVEGEKLIQEFQVPGASFRFYNVSGCDPKLKPTGEATHLIRRAAMAARNDTTMGIFGDDWDTRDGTCVRDYIDVRDLADALATAIDTDFVSTMPFDCLGSGTGFTVREIVNTMSTVAGKQLDVEIKPRRDGDVGSMICPPELIYPGLTIRHNVVDMCRSALEVTT